MLVLVKATINEQFITHCSTWNWVDVNKKT